MAVFERIVPEDMRADLESLRFQGVQFSVSPGGIRLDGVGFRQVADFLLQQDDRRTGVRGRRTHDQRMRQRIRRKLVDRRAEPVTDSVERGRALALYTARFTFLATSPQFQAAVEAFFKMTDGSSG